MAAAAFHPLLIDGACVLIPLAILLLIVNGTSQHALKNRLRREGEKIKNAEPVIATLAKSLTVLLILAMVILWPPLLASRDNARQAECRSNLFTISLHLASYAGEHDDQYPPSLDVLVAEGELTEGHLVCPRAPKRLARYVYVPPAASPQENTIVVAERYIHPHIDGDRRNYIRVSKHDGTIPGVADEEFQRLLAKPENAEMAKALKQAATP
jgi:competence protein ComGC